MDICKLWDVKLVHWYNIGVGHIQGMTAESVMKAK